MKKMYKKGNIIHVLVDLKWSNLLSIRIYKINEIYFWSCTFFILTNQIYIILLKLFSLRLYIFTIMTSFLSKLEFNRRNNIRRQKY